MKRKIHYEIFACKGRGARAHWSLLEAHEDRAAAIARAEGVMREGGFQGVRVTKEAYNEESGTFFSVRVYEEGEKSGQKKADKDEEVIPCFKPQDLYTVHARETIASVLKETLAQWNLTPIELVHRADTLEKLEASGTALQHAIQKVSIAQASGGNRDVAEIMKRLQELVDKALARVYQDDRAGVFPTLKGDDLMTVWTQIAASEEADYRLSGAIARALADKHSWSKKIACLVTLATQALKAGKAAETPIKVIDDFMAEIVQGQSGLSDLIGNQEHLGAALHVMADLYLGKIDPQQDGISEGARLLSAAFAKGRFTDARGALARRILHELQSTKRLCPGDPKTEVYLMRKLAVRLVMGQGPLMPIDTITGAFGDRSKRLVTDGWIADYLDAATSPDEQIEMLIRLEENVVGEDNKRKLASFTMPVLTAYKTEMHYLQLDTPPTKRLARLAELQRSLFETDFPDLQKRTLGEALDKLARRIEEEADLIGGIERRKATKFDRCYMLLRLCFSGTLTEGALAEKARTAALKLARGPDLARELADFRVSDAGASEASAKKITDFRGLLKKAEREAR
ncbi:MAG: hypothetical protein AAGB03_05200, partial [Pseudomonadota bacterium]